MKSDPANEKEPFIPWDDECALPAPDEEAIKKRSELLQQQVVEDVVEEKHTIENEEAEVENQVDYTDFDELD